MAYAAGDPAVERVFSIAGTDHAQFIRRYFRDSQYAAMIDPAVASAHRVIRFEQASGMTELFEMQDRLALIDNAFKLADRTILLIGGWEDVNVTVDDTMLPLYRALRQCGAKDVTFHTYHDNHGFGSVRAALHRDLLGWIGEIP